MTFELIGAPEQINTTPGPLAVEGLATQSGETWAFYLPASSDIFAGLTGDLIAREINASGVPTGSEIDLPVPAAQTGYAIFGADGAVLVDGSFIVSYLQPPTTTTSLVSDIVHYSATGTVLGSFLVDGFASPEALSTGGFSLSEAGFGSTSAPNAVIATYAETATTPSSSTTVATAAAGQEIVAESLPTTAGAVGEVVTLAETSGTSSVDLTLPGATTPLVFSAPAADSATTSYYVLPTNIVAASDGSFYTAITTSTLTATTGTNSIAVYDIISGAPQLLTTIAPPSTFLSASSSIALLSNGDIAVEYSGAPQTTSGGEAGIEQYVELLSPTGAQIGPTLSLGVGPGGDTLSVLSNGDLATLVYGSSGLFVQQLGLGGASPDLVEDNFNGGIASDLLLQNATGAVAVGAIGGNGQESYTQVAALGPEWSFQGNGDFLGNGQDQFLIENTSGAVDVGNVVNGQAQYTQVAALGPEWTFQGTGDFLGNGQDQFLIENTSGGVDVGNVVNGQTQYTQVAALGPEWTFEGTGDFLGNGQDQFLVENTSGAVDVGNVVNGQTQYTQVAALGPEWTFEGTGDFLGNGQDQFLIENTSGAVDVGNVVNGQVQYTQVAALGPEWSFIGTGDYQGTGTAGFMIENTAGAVALGTISNGQASYSQVGALGPEWSSHSSHA